MNYSVMNKIMSLLACICEILMFVEFRSLVEGPGMSFFGESFFLRLRRHAATLPLFLEKTFSSLTSFSTCEVVTAGKDWAADKFVWVRLPNGRFRPGDRSSVRVLARPPNRRFVICCGMRSFATVNCAQVDGWG